MTIKSVVIVALLIVLFSLFCSGCSPVEESADTQTQEKARHVSEIPSENKENMPMNGVVRQKRLVPSKWEDDGIFSLWYHYAYQTLKTMSLEEKAGQMLFARCPQSEGAMDAMQYQLGGYVLFKRDFYGMSKEEVQDTLRRYRESTKIPMAFSVDEEGGSVIRISSNPELRDKPYLSPQELYRQGGWDLIGADSREKAVLLEELGIDVLLAPVADLAESSGDYIYDRTLGKGAEDTGKYVEIVVREVQQNKVSATLKHFPGYGGNADTHKTDSVDRRDISEFRKRDFIPFLAGIEAGADLILVSHNIVDSINPDLPASMSPESNRILREELGFTGIIITDDLAMKAARTGSLETSPVVQAALAGNNMIIVTDYAGAHSDLLAALAAGIVTEEQIDSAVFRILAWKYKLGLLRGADGPVSEAEA